MLCPRHLRNTGMSTALNDVGNPWTLDGAHVCPEQRSCWLVLGHSQRRRQRGGALPMQKAPSCTEQQCHWDGDLVYEATAETGEAVAPLGNGAVGALRCRFLPSLARQHPRAAPEGITR
jgi:hypothetical protein